MHLDLFSSFFLFTLSSLIVIRKKKFYRCECCVVNVISETERSEIEIKIDFFHRSLRVALKFACLQTKDARIGVYFN